MFADDVKMYLKIINDIDIAHLQLALIALVEWANEWQFAISIEKCCVLNISKQMPALHLPVSYTHLTLPTILRV